MRGTPFLQAILIVAAFLLAGIPTFRLTRPAAAAAIDSTPETPAVAPTPAKSAPLEVAVIFAPAPADFQIINLGQTVLAGRGPQARFTGLWTAAVPPEGVDLVVRARWPIPDAANAGTPSEADPRAMQVTVRFPGGVLFTKTLWAAANGELDEVLTVPGETAVADSP